MEDQDFCKPLFLQIPEQKRATILAVAEDEFARRGFTETSIASIADKAGVSVGSLYKYFVDKEALYLSLVQRSFKILEAALTPILEARVGLLDKLSGILDTLFEQGRRNAATTRLYHRFTTETNPELASGLANRLETFTARNYAALLASAREEGLVKSTVDARVLAYCLDNTLLALQFALATPYHQNRLKIYLGAELASDYKTLKAQLIEFFARALGIEKPRVEQS